MKEQVLSVEQMLKLEELGIDTSGASMFWYSCGKFKQLIPCANGDTIAEWTNMHGEQCITPAFTLQDILEIIPNEIDGCTKRISMYPMNGKNISLVYYEDTTTYSEHHELTSLGKLGQVTHKILHGEYDKPMLKAAFDMLKWCKQNNYI